MRVATIVHVSEAYHLRIKNHQRHGKLEAKLKTRAGNIELLKLIPLFHIPVHRSSRPLTSVCNFRVSASRGAEQRDAGRGWNRRMKGAYRRRAKKNRRETKGWNDDSKKFARSWISREGAESRRKATPPRSVEREKYARERGREGERRGLSFALWKSRTARART